MMFRSLFTRIGELTAHPAAFLILLVYVVGWGIFDRDSLNWHGFATIATWAMTLFIQRSEYRDTLAIHAKLDELLRSHGEARTELTHLDDRELEEVREHRDRERDRDRA